MHPGGCAVTGLGAAILDAEGTRLSRGERRLFGQVAPFGFILFSRNLDTPEQIRALCDEMREAAGHAAPVFIDQEGGRVQRLRPPLARDWPPPLEQVAAAGRHAPEAMRLRYRMIASELRGLGIDGNCAPVLDLAGAGTHGFLRDRCYGAAPGTVSAIGRAVAEGLLEGGVLPVLKHIPGHGRATDDSHHALPSVDAPAETLEAEDFAPFRALADMPLAMTAHVVYTALDTRPATVSGRTVRTIRDTIGYDGLIMTDDISMQALDGLPQALAEGAREAGCDLVLYCNGSLDARREVAAAAGRMDAAAQRRADRALALRQAPAQFDDAAAEARLAALVTGDPGHG